MIKELEELRTLLKNAAMLPMVESHMALLEARGKINDLIKRARENEAAQEFLKKQYARTIY